ncbi:peptide chain release factor N(5)-glutamine methyltransferase [Bacillaceae bacterium S4-13-58]
MHWKTNFEARRWASLFLQQHNREPLVADLLLQHLLKKNRAQMLASWHDAISDTVGAEYERLIRSHALDGVPIQHMIGHTEFFGREFKVNKDVLIPRPETEELIVETKKRLLSKNHFAKKVDGSGKHLERLNSGNKKELTRINSKLTGVDVGTGSGIIAITLALECSNIKMTATDISEAALIVAKDNASELKADIEFCHGNLLEPLIESGQKVDLVISNPPYIPESERELLSDVVVNHEPSLALFAEDNGLAIYKKLLEQIPFVIDGEALIAFEIGHDQGETVPELIKNQFPDSNHEVVRDINGKDRMVFAWVSN